MNVLVVGYGSIGKRHVENLLKLRQIDQIIVCSSHHDSFQNHPEKEKLKLVRSLEELSPMMSHGRQIRFAIVANETYRHIETANDPGKFRPSLCFLKNPFPIHYRRPFFKKIVQTK